ncbi:unnamed protein product, partial [marine sediment metagenome]
FHQYVEEPAVARDLVLETAIDERVPGQLERELVLRLVLALEFLLPTPEKGRAPCA